MSGFIGVVAAAVALIAVNENTGERVQLAPKVYHATQAPEQAAACIARNAENRTGGGSSFVQPLYGNDQIAVVMSDATAGDKLATAYLAPASQGSHVKIVATPPTADVEALAKQLLAKC